MAIDFLKATNFVKAMTLAMDEGVGEIVAVLKELDLEKKTLVMFISDNGGTGQNKSPGSLLRGQKGSIWEGGHRVPAIASWPGTIKAGTVTAETAMTIDLMPTMMALNHAKLPDGHKLDGTDLSALLTQGTPLPKRDLFWALQDGRAKAVRRGPWKLVRQGTKQELYNLAEDLKETKDVAGEKPELATALAAALTSWEKDVATGATVQPPPPASASSTPKKKRQKKRPQGS